MLRLVWVETYDGGPGYLIVVMSHLIADGVSWRILLEDLEFAYLQARAGSEVTLSISTTSFAEWAHRLQRYAQSEAVRTEASYWTGLLHDSTSPLPVDDSQRRSSRTIERNDPNRARRNRHAGAAVSRILVVPDRDRRLTPDGSGTDTEPLELQQKCVGGC